MAQESEDLERRGIGDDLLSELQELGPKAAAEIQLMTEMSDDQLDEYVSLFKAKNRIATPEAVAEMEPMRGERYPSRLHRCSGDRQNWQNTSRNMYLP